MAEPFHGVVGKGGCSTQMSRGDASMLCDAPATRTCDNIPFCEYHHRLYIALKLAVAGHPENR